MKKTKKEFKIEWLGSEFIIKIDEKDITTFKDMFKISQGVFDFLRQLDFMNVKYECERVEK